MSDWSSDVCSSDHGVKPSELPTGGDDTLVTPSSPNATNAPSASMAPSLSNDSKAIASTKPRLCSAADACRVPTSMANTAIHRATYNELTSEERRVGKE